MGYRIEYRQGHSVRKRETWTATMKLSLIGGIVVGSSLGILIFFPGQVEALRQLLLPCRDGFTIFLENLQAGTDFTEAVANFCQELLQGA